MCDIANYDRFSDKNWVTLLPPSGSGSVTHQPLPGCHPPGRRCDDRLAGPGCHLGGQVLNEAIHRCPLAPGVAYPGAAKVGAAGGFAAQTAAGLMVQVMGSNAVRNAILSTVPAFQLHDKIALELALGVFDPPIVGRPIRRAVDRDHQGLLKHLVDRQVVQVPAVVALAEQRRLEPVEQILQMPGHFFPQGKP